MALNGHSSWLRDDQVILFPVLIFGRLPILDCYDLFHRDLKFSDEIVARIRSFLEEIVAEDPSVRIITMAEWVLEIQLARLERASVSRLEDLVRDLNLRIIKSLEQEFGTMPLVSPQPSPLHVKHRLFKIGAR